MLIGPDGATGILDTILGHDSALIGTARLYHSGHAPLRTARTDSTTRIGLVCSVMVAPRIFLEKTIPRCLLSPALYSVRSSELIANSEFSSKMSLTVSVSAQMKSLFILLCIMYLTQANRELQADIYSTTSYST